MRHLIAYLFLCLVGITTQAHAANNCDVSGITTTDWLAPDPTSLAEVPNGIDANNCDFHIYSWRWFTYLLNPLGQTDQRNFEDRAIYPVVDLDTCTSLQTAAHPVLSHGGVTVGLAKQPDIPDQATGNALYDKNGNIVFYNRSFTANECGIFANGNFPDAGNANAGFPTGKDQVVELKTSWQILDPSVDNSSYYTQTVALEGEGDLLLGLIGAHIVVNTAIHPEFVWATFEHVSNAPNCTVNTGTGYTRPQPADGWNLVGPTCNACVAKNYADGTDLRTACASACDWNPSNKVQPLPQVDSNGNTIIKGTPSDICLVEYLGTSSTQSGAQTNIDNIEFLNTLLAGPGGLIATQGSTDMNVLQNYFLAGAVWTDMSSFDMSSTDPFNSDMAGSHALANSSMESFSQPNSNSSSFFDTGCFSCHGGATPQNTAEASHLLTSEPGAAPGLMNRCNVKADFYDQSGAEAQCPLACGSASNWNGNWINLVPGSVSACGCNTCVGN
ncbi:mannan-binding lectin [Alisedimentitalea sp. MJ-SS2]|uniref:mannan-binding lectin n=1 Tax=Aliisedimentitalea sp. MJ-SS2 TaxID=3049795 RepID=UPI002911A0B7|nr:mannan-binding lectin [Alisedimentitalea sp. MJ-SS2]MDU8926583.1 mannan-binding lectin [Alisedimentitalea sp. MJ-SS2]